MIDAGSHATRLRDAMPRESSAPLRPA
jgi:hypothetical protein